MERGIFLVGGGFSVNDSNYASEPCKTAAPVEMPFGFWARMDRRNHVLDGGPAVLKDVAMATIVGFCILYIWGAHWHHSLLSRPRPPLRTYERT